MSAGLGKRLHPFTDKAPKPLLPVLGIPIIEYALYWALESGTNEVVINYHHHKEQMLKYLKSKQVDKRILSSSEENLLLGSAGGIRKSMTKTSGERFIVLNSDNIFSPNLSRLTQLHQEGMLKDNRRMTLILKKNYSNKHNYREILVDHKTGLVLSAGELSSEGYFYTGVCIFEKAAFEHLMVGVNADFLKDVLTTLIKQKKVGFVLEEEPWLDIGTPELWYEAHFELLKNKNFKFSNEINRKFKDLGVSSKPLSMGFFEDKQVIEDLSDVNGQIYYGSREKYKKISKSITFLESTLNFF